MSNLKPQWLFMTVLIHSGCASAPPPPQSVLANRAAVRVDREMDRGQYRYRVEGALGYTQDEARVQAIEAALAFAAKQVTGDPSQKTQAINFVKDNFVTVQSLATPGQIFKRNMVADRFEIGIYVMVQTQDLERALIENRVISSSQKTSKKLGRPTLMVLSRQGVCKPGSDAPRCVTEDHMKQLATQIENHKKGVYIYQDRIVKAGCVNEEKVKTLVEASNSSSRTYQRRGVGYRRFYRGYYSGESAGSSLSTRRYRSMTDQVRNSRNCRVFVQGLEKRERKLINVENKLEKLQDEHARLRMKDSQTTVTTTKLNQYFVDARWRIVDQKAVEEARRTQQAISNVSGLATDPVAQLAQLAGADIYVQFGTSESRAGGGYQVELDVKAFDVVSGDLLASRVSKSRRLASSDLAAAVTEAAGKAMPIVLDQIQGYWSDMIKEGTRTKIILRGAFRTNKRSVIRTLDDVIEALPGCDDHIDCTFRVGMVTAQTIEGEFIVPAKRRSRVGLTLEGSLQDAGFSTEVIVTNPALHMIRVL